MTHLYSILQMPKKQNNRTKQEKHKEEPEDDWIDEEEDAEEEPNTAKGHHAPKQETAKHQFSLYDLLELTKTATHDEIKKQYRKLVLQYHPDKNQSDPTARQKFQKLREAYQILSDSDKRKQYDQTGRIGDNFDEATFQSAYQYFRSMFKKVTEEDILAFQKQYRHSKQEEKDLIDYYQSHNGDMVELLENIMLSTNQDVPRFIQFYQSLIEKKELPKKKSFDKTKGKVRLLKMQEQQAQAEKLKGLTSLALAIQAKHSAHNDFIASLEQKYGVGKKKKLQKAEKGNNVKKQKSNGKNVK